MNEFSAMCGMRCEEKEHNMTKFDAKWVAEEQAKRAMMSEQGLYRKEDEHSSCGVGLVVSVDHLQRYDVSGTSSCFLSRLEGRKV